LLSFALVCLIGAGQGLACCAFGEEPARADYASGVTLSWDTPCFELSRRWDPATHSYEIEGEQWSSSISTIHIVCPSDIAPSWIRLGFTPSLESMDVYLTPGDGIGEYAIDGPAIKFLANPGAEYELLLRLVCRGGLSFEHEQQQIGAFTLAVESILVPEPVLEPEAELEAETEYIEPALDESAAEPLIAEAHFPDGTLGRYYRAELLSNSELPVSWSIVGGALPEGLELRGGLVSGVPTGDAGTYYLTV